jgi:hypothetical protein
VCWRRFANRHNAKEAESLDAQSRRARTRRPSRRPADRWVSLTCELQRDCARVETVPAIVEIVLNDRLLKQ